MLAGHFFPVAVWLLVQQAKVQDETRVHVLTQTLHESIKVYVSHLYLSENAKKKKKKIISTLR